MEAARSAVKARGVRQADVARLLEVSQGAVSHALSREGARYSALQKRIVEALTDFELIEAEVKYEVRHKG